MKEKLKSVLHSFPGAQGNRMQCIGGSRARSIQSSFCFSVFSSDMQQCKVLVSCIVGVWWKCVATANVSSHVKAASTSDIVLVAYILPKVMLLCDDCLGLVMMDIDW